MISSLFRAFARVLATFRGRALDSDFDEELATHVDMLASELEKGGLASDDARRAARVRFGNRQAARQLHRDTRSLPLIETILQDIRYVTRIASGNKTFTAVAIGCLALGIGANTTIFSVMESILFRPLPVERPEDLVVLRLTADRPPTPETSPIRVFRGPINLTDAGLAGFVVPYPFFELLLGENDVFDGILARQPLNGVIVNHGDGNDATMADGTYVSAEYFSTLGIRPVAGRFFAEDDDRLDASATIVLTRAFAGARFGGPEAAIGQSIRLNDVPFTVVGVTSDDFHGLDPSRNPVFFVPLATGPLFWDTGSAANSAEMRVDARDYWVNAVGRLRNGISRTQAETILAQRFDAFARSSVESNAQLENLPSLSLLDAGNGTDVLRVRYRAPLYVLAAMVVLILAVACANIAGLLMSRATARRREMAVRLSVGAGRWRVIRQLLTESVMLAGAGGLAGIILSFWGMQLVATLLLASEPNFTLRPELNWIVLGFTALVSIATGVLFGLAPAVEATRVDLATALKGARSRGVVAGRPGRLPGFGSSLVVLQIALSLLLLVGAGLFARTLSNLRNTELGFENENLLLANVATRGSDYTGDRLKTFYTDLRRRLLEIPGVEGANSARPDLPSKLCYRDRQSIVW